MHRKAATSSRQLHLNINLLHSGTYASAWRLPDSDPHACFDVGHYVRVAQIAERGKLDAIFLADTPAITDRIERGDVAVIEASFVSVRVVSYAKASCFRQRDAPTASTPRQKIFFAARVPVKN